MRTTDIKYMLLRGRGIFHHGHCFAVLVTVWRLRSPQGDSLIAPQLPTNKDDDGS